MAIKDMTISGKVRTGDGSGVSGATVSLLETAAALNGTAHATTDTTDSAGTWNFTVEGSTYTLANNWDVQISSSGGDSIRYLPWSDEIALKGVDTSYLKVRGADTVAAPIYLLADRADAAGDAWRIQATPTTGSTGTLAIGNDKASAGTIIDYLTITHGASAAASVVALGGDLTVGDDLSLTSDSAVIALGADGDTTLTHTDGTGLTLNSTNKLTFGDADTFIHQSSDGVLTIESDTTVDINGAVALNGAVTGATAITSGTIDATTDFTIGDTVITDGVITDSTGLQLAANLDIDGTADISGDLTLSGGADGALQFTNAGENSIKIPDNQASALIIEEADDAYITFVTTNSSEAITVAKATTFSAGIANAGTISAGTWNGTAITGAYINDDIISGQAEITSSLAAADELLYSDAGTVKRVGVDTLTTYLAGVNAGTVTSTGLSDSSGVISLDIQNMTASSTIADADLIVIDDGAGGTLRKMTRANFIESAALDAINIDGGAIDGAVIGANSAAAITGTTIDAGTDFTIGNTVITDGVITDTAGIQIVGTGYPLNIHRAASSANYLGFTNDATGSNLGADSFDIGLAGSGYALIRHRKDDQKIAIGTEGTNRVVIEADGDTSFEGNSILDVATFPIIKIGATTLHNDVTGGTATNYISLFNGTAPAGTLTNGATFFCASGEMKVIDAAGNITVLSPHDDNNQWVFHSRNSVTGKVLHIHMEKLMRRLDEEFGGGFIEEFLEA